MVVSSNGKNGHSISKEVRAGNLDSGQLKRQNVIFYEEGSSEKEGKEGDTDRQQ
jgi:hypothetical protein